MPIGGINTVVISSTHLTAYSNQIARVLILEGGSLPRYMKCFVCTTVSIIYTEIKILVWWEGEWGVVVVAALPRLLN
jgi:hypothetical protein